MISRILLGLLGSSVWAGAMYLIWPSRSAAGVIDTIAVSAGTLFFWWFACLTGWPRGSRISMEREAVRGPLPEAQTFEDK